MPLAEVRYHEAESDLPDVCLRCGRPAVCRVGKTIRLYRMANGYGYNIFSPLLMMLDFVGYFSSATMVLRGPFCAAHRHHWVFRRVLMWSILALLPFLLLFFVLPLYLSGAISGGAGAGLCFGILFVGIMSACFVYGTSTYKFSCFNEGETLVLAHVHAGFIQALEKKRESMQAKKAAKRPPPLQAPNSRFAAADVPVARHAANPFADLDAGEDAESPRRQPRRSNQNHLAIVLTAAIGAPLVLLVFVAWIVNVGKLAEGMFHRDSAPEAENRREPARERPPREGQAREAPPREEEHEVEQGTIVPNSPPLPPLPAELDGKPSINLTPLARPRKDVVHGRWLVADKALHCNDGSFVPRIQFPYRPPAEYDFAVTFWQQELRNGISLVMPNPNGGSFFWFLGNEDGAGYGFHSSPNKEGRRPGLIKAQTIHTTVVQVRKGSVRALVDGKEMMRLQTDFHDLACDDWRRIHNTDFVAVACDDPTVFYHVRIVEVSGKGKKGS
jgi:hypothetical protein